jgi:hypothetical protein
LIANDRHEEALDTMARFHGEGSRYSPIVVLEYKEMVEDISVTGSDKRWWDYRVCYRHVSFSHGIFSVGLGIHEMFNGIDTSARSSGCRCV